MALNTNKALTMTQSIINCSNAPSPIKKIHLYFLRESQCSFLIGSSRCLNLPFS